VVTPAEAIGEQHSKIGACPSHGRHGPHGPSRAPPRHRSPREEPSPERPRRRGPGVPGQVRVGGDADRPSGVVPGGRL